MRTVHRNRFSSGKIGRELEKLLDEEGRMYISVRQFPGFWMPRPLPEGIGSLNEAREYARRVAEEEGKRVCLFHPGSEIIIFDGSVSSRGMDQGPVARG